MRRRGVEEEEEAAEEILAASHDRDIQIGELPFPPAVGLQGLLMQPSLDMSGSCELVSSHCVPVLAIS